MWRAILVWLLIMLVETVHGVARGLLLVPRVGEEMASRIGWPVGMILVLLISAAAIRWVRLRGTRALLAVGAVWAVLTIGFEFLIGHLRGMSAAAMLASRPPRMRLSDSLVTVKQTVRPSYPSCHFWQRRLPETHQRPRSFGVMYLPSPAASPEPSTTPFRR